MVNQLASTVMPFDQWVKAQFAFPMTDKHRVSVDELEFSATCESEEIKKRLREYHGGDLDLAWLGITDDDLNQILFFLKSNRIKVDGSLWLHQNQISELLAGAFQGLIISGDLRLDNNQISKLVTHAFLGLILRGHLLLINNQISELLAGAFQGLIIGGDLSLDNNQISEIVADTMKGMYLGGHVFGPDGPVIGREAMKGVLVTNAGYFPMLRLTSPELEWIPAYLDAPVPEGFKVSFEKCVERVKTVMLCAHRIACVFNGDDRENKTKLPAMPTEMWLAIMKEGCGGNIISCLNGVREDTLGKVIGKKPPKEALQGFWKDQTPMLKFFLEEPSEKEAAASAPVPHKAPGEIIFPGGG